VTDKVQMQTKKLSYTYDYDKAIELAKLQTSIFWTDDEINVDKDIQDIRVNMSLSESHGVTTTLRLFTLYELFAGRDYWLGRVMRMFPRPDIERMAAVFGFFELNVHAPFYNKINEALHLNTDEFYLSYVKDPILKERMEDIESLICDEDDLLSLAGFSMVEGAVLYSAFAFLKHFQARGKNKLLNVVRGINFSVRDEDLHCKGGAWLFGQLMSEKKAAGLLSDTDIRVLEIRIKETAAQILEHELRIAEMIFELGPMEGITLDAMQTFIESRINVCLSQLNIGPLVDKVGDNPIADWFYKDINMVQFHDFFTGIGNSYNRDWDESKFLWRASDDKP